MTEFKQKFENSFFGLEIFGFSKPFHFSGNNIGISTKKYFDEKNVCLIKIGILNPSEDDLQQLTISATHGKASEDSITIREEVNLRDPIDLFSSKNSSGRFFTTHSLYLKNKYYYNKQSQVFLINKKAITPQELVNEIYLKHIKSTKLISGFLLRLQLLFWQSIIPQFLYFVFYNLFHYLLLLISGDRYTYNVFLEKGEVKDNQEPESRWNKDKKDKELKSNEEKSKELDILGYKASRRAVIVYAIINLGIYISLFYFDKIPKVVEKIMDNTVGALFYVIVSLCFFDTALPKFLKFLIDQTSKLSYYFIYRPIRV